MDLSVVLCSFEGVNLSDDIFVCLFITFCLPVYHQELLEAVFSPCGQVENVYLHKKPTAGLPDVSESKFFPTAPVIKVSCVHVLMLWVIQGTCI